MDVASLITYHLSLITPLRCLPLFLLAFLAIFLVREHVFFWDTIQLGAKHAHWYFEQQFSHFLLPASIDSGHPPTFGMYIAAMWTLFGKSLAVSHFAMLPFGLANIYLLYHLGIHFLGKNWGILFALLVFFDPTLAAQSLLVSPDVVLMTFFLLGLLSILKQKNSLLVLASIGLAALSMRGMMVVVVLYLLYALEQSDYTFKPKNWLYSTLPFLPSGLLALAFLGYHYQQTGWIGFHADSPWAASFERVNAQGFLKNVALYLWRLLDFGRVFVWLPLLLLLGFWFRQYKGHSFRFDARFRFLIVLLIISILVLSPSLLLYKGLLGHRYLLPIFMVASFACIYLIFSIQANRKWLLLLPFLGLLTGNLWIYPKHIAQGWDATLAHLPYYSLRADAYAFIENKQIDWADVGSVFPELGADKYRSLSERTDGFERADLDRHRYVFYATIMNDFSDAELEILAKDWEIIYQKETWGIYVILYERT